MGIQEMKKKKKKKTKSCHIGDTKQMINVSCRKQFNRTMGSIIPAFPQPLCSTLFQYYIVRLYFKCWFFRLHLQNTANTVKSFNYLFTNSCWIKHNCLEDYIQSNSYVSGYTSMSIPAFSDSRFHFTLTVSANSITVSLQTKGNDVIYKWEVGLQILKGQN